jgi:hypothetical protein
MLPEWEQAISGIANSIVGFLVGAVKIVQIAL